MKKIFYSFDIKFTLLFGTVLGAIRENDFIEYDTDTDIGIFKEDLEKLLKAIPILLDNEFELIRTRAPDDLVTFMRNDEYIDIGIFRLTKKNFIEYYTYQGHLIGREFLDILEEIEFLGEKFYVPNNKELYLSKTYGKDWHKPKRNEPAMNIGYANYYYRSKRFFLKTSFGSFLKVRVKKMIGRS